MSKKKLSINRYSALSYSVLFALVIIVILLSQVIANTKIDKLYHFIDMYSYPAKDDVQIKLSSFYNKNELTNGSYLLRLNNNNLIVEQYRSPYKVGQYLEVDKYLTMLSNNRFISLEEYYDNGDKNTILIYNTQFLENQSDINAEIFKINITMAIVIVLLIALIMAIALIINRKVFVLPFAKMSESIEEIGDSNYKNINTNYSIAEMVTLSKAINSMSDRIRQELKQRKELEHDKQLMLMNLSHDFKTPLSNIIGYSEELLKDSCGEVSTSLHVIKNNGYKLNEMLNSLLELAYLENNSLKLKREKVEVNEFVRNILINYIAEFESMSKEYRINISDVNLYVMFDKAKITRMIDNMINNSIKYAGDNAYISISVKELGDKVSISVSDNGIGVPIDEVENITKPFVRLDENRTDSVEGFGLGLSLVKDIVIQHGGKLEIESASQQGFKISAIFNLIKKGS